MKAGKSTDRRHASGAHQTTPRHVWLAGLGLAMLTCRELGGACTWFGEKADALYLRVIDLSGRARSYAQGAPDHSI